MDDIIIRPANLADLDSVTAVEAACFPPAEAASRSSLAQRLSVYGESFLVAEAKGEIIGFINGSVASNPTITDEMFDDISLHQPNGCYQAVFGLDVLPDYRRRGIAARLMEALIASARRQGRKGLILTCKAHLLDYYAKFGYQNQGVSQSVHGGAQWYDMTLLFDEK